jgi:DnaJ-class molecular chaperone
MTDDDDSSECPDCAGKGWNWQEQQVAERKSDVQEFMVECESCGGAGRVYG